MTAMFFPDCGNPCPFFFDTRRIRLGFQVAESGFLSRNGTGEGKALVSTGIPPCKQRLADERLVRAMQGQSRDDRHSGFLHMRGRNPGRVHTIYSKYAIPGKWKSPKRAISKSKTACHVSVATSA
jgi:hypothetical protein